MSRRAEPRDPTARAAIQRNHDDPIGMALAQLRPIEAQFLVAHLAFQVPVAVLVRVYVAGLADVMPDFDYVGHVNGMLARGTTKLRKALAEANPAGDDLVLDWENSSAVQKLGREIGATTMYPCQFCRRETISAVQPVGRRRTYCSNACRQAAYRQRRAQS